MRTLRSPRRRGAVRGLRPQSPLGRPAVRGLRPQSPLGRPAVRGLRPQSPLGRPAVALTLALFSAMAFVNGRRSMVASSLGMDTVPDDAVAVMAMRAAANQFGYLLGAAGG